MYRLVILGLVLGGSYRVFAEPAESAFCQRCKSQCFGEREINVTAIVELIVMEIRKALLPNNGGGTISENQNKRNIPQNCQEIPLESAKSRNRTGGVFDVDVPDLGIHEIYCDVRTDGGNWIVFQRRMDGSLDFNRAWNDYVNGFGNVNGEFWLGLNAIHQLTKSGNYELRFDMIEEDGTHYYAKYSSFKVGPASDYYRLSVSGYAGNATDSFADPPGTFGDLNGMRFSTADVDNDSNNGNCAKVFEGGWWFNSCYNAFLNGKYGRLDWIDQARNTDLYMQFTEMKFRLKQ